MYLRRGLLVQSPRLIFEAALVVALLGGLILAFAIGQRPAEVIPTLVLFGASAFRIVPTIARLMSQIHQFRFTLPALDLLAEDIEEANRSEARKAILQSGSESPLGDFKEIAFKRVRFFHPDATTPTLDKVTFSIGRGELVCIAGPSGAGKSTVADILLGLLLRRAARSCSTVSLYKYSDRIFRLCPAGPFRAYGHAHRECGDRIGDGPDR